eukprot:INCI15393.2.p1 GENE.INCI15393.2~~INCI15393.2.p1  ORF type:complete len:307 (+),score=29.40 INCI15393.2:91-1011(+)
MRRRKAAATFGQKESGAMSGWKDDDDLQVEQSVPLLAGDPPTSRVYPAMSARLKPSSKAGGGRTNPCTGLAMWLAGCCGLRSAGPSGGRPGAPAEIQSYSDFALLEELPVLERFRQILAERCDFDLPEHEALLQDLRRKLRPASGTSGEGFDWRTLGFQSRNSRTDFRGAGLAGLRCLNYLATHYAPEYAQYVALANQATREENSGPGAVSYPCSASALAFVLVLVNRLRLSLRPPLLSPDCGSDIQLPSPFDRDDLRTVLRFILTDGGERTFSELFCAGVYVMHRTWVSKPREELDIVYVVLWNH